MPYYHALVFDMNSELDGNENNIKYMIVPATDARVGHKSDSTIELTVVFENATNRNTWNHTLAE